MGNDLNCCRTTTNDELSTDNLEKNKNTNTIDTDNEGKVIFNARAHNPSLVYEEVQIKSSKNANQHFLASNGGHDKFEIAKPQVQFNVNEKIKTSQDVTYEDDKSSLYVPNLENKKSTEKDINKDFNRDYYLIKFKDENLAKREQDFPPFNKKYAIKTSQLDFTNDNIYVEKDIIYDHGSLASNNTSIYWGERNSELLKHGYGTLLYSNGSRYEGFWMNDQFSLWGRHVDSDGTIREGEFQNGYLDGQGSESTSTGQNYKGQFKNGIKEGLGKLMTENDDYEGSFKNNLKHGRGKIKFLKTGNSYEGSFVEGKIEGFGLFKWANNDEYSGSFVNGILHGEGCYKWSNGDVYEGTYKEGVRSGNGKLTNKQGKVYQGQFSNNLPHGRGSIIKDGKISDVEFSNGVPLKKSPTIK